MTHIISIMPLPLQLLINPLRHHRIGDSTQRPPHRTQAKLQERTHLIRTIKQWMLRLVDIRYAEADFRPISRPSSFCMESPYNILSFSRRTPSSHRPSSRAIMPYLHRLKQICPHNFFRTTPSGTPSRLLSHRDDLGFMDALEIDATILLQASTREQERGRRLRPLA